MATTIDCGKDYVTLKQLYEYLGSLRADTRVDLCTRAAERGRIVFGAPDDQDVTLPVTRDDDDDWNTLSFRGNDMSTTAELVALLEPWVAEHGYAGVMRNGQPLFLSTPSCVRLPTQSLAYKRTALNHHRSAAALLSGEAGGDPRRAYELLRERFGRRVAAEAVFYAVGRRWHDKDELFRLYPDLPRHADWERLFPRCDAGELRQCGSFTDAFVAQFGPKPSPIDQLLALRSATATTMATATTTTTATATATATVVMPDAGRDARHGTAAPDVPCSGDALPAPCSAGDALCPTAVVVEASPAQAQTEPPVKTKDPTPAAACTTCSCCGGRLT